MGEQRGASKEKGGFRARLDRQWQLAAGYSSLPALRLIRGNLQKKQRMFFDMQSHQTFPSHRHNIHVVSHRRLFHQVCFQYQAIAATIANIERIRKQFIELERDIMEGILSR